MHCVDHYLTSLGLEETVQRPEPGLGSRALNKHSHLSTHFEKLAKFGEGLPNQAIRHYWLGLVIGLVMR